MDTQNMKKENTGDAISREIGEMLIREDHFQEEMEEKAEPCLAAHKEELLIYREDDHPIYCVRYIPENPQSLLVISHGFCETTEKYREFIYYFLKENVAVYIYDHCGHGRSYRLTRHPNKVHVDSYVRYRNDLLFVAHTAHREHPDLVLNLYGHSMGGAVAAAAAAAEPDLFNKVILNAPMIRPLTGDFPWKLTAACTKLFCRMGKAENFALGQKPYDAASDTYEACGSLSEPRFRYYKEIKESDTYCQMGGASYGWLLAAVEMNEYLQREGWKTICAPVLLFQAEDERFVSNEQEEVFIRKLHSRSSAKLVRVPDSRHEIYNSHDDILEQYLKKVFRFYGVGRS